MYTMRGSPEVQVFEAVPLEGISSVDLKVCLNPIPADGNYSFGVCQLPTEQNFWELCWFRMHWQGRLDSLVYDVGFKTAMKNRWLQTTKGLVSRKVLSDRGCLIVGSGDRCFRWNGTGVSCWKLGSLSHLSCLLYHFLSVTLMLYRSKTWKMTFGTCWLLFKMER